MKHKKKLIEVALPLEAINKASAREKSIRHGHPSTLHLWWARRPLAAARAVIFAQMVDDPSSCPDLFPTEKAQAKERQRLFRIIEDLVLWENTTNETVMQAARDEIWQSWRRACAENVDHPRAKELFDRHKLIDLAIVTTLEDRGFDQAPVYDTQRRIAWGLVETQRLRVLAERGEALSPEDPVLRAQEVWFRIGHYVSVDRLLETMARQRAVLVVQESDATEYGHAEWDLGLMTISDLNRHPLRANLYTLMSHVEAGLAALVERAFPDAWTWRGLVKKCVNEIRRRPSSRAGSLHARR